MWWGAVWGCPSAKGSPVILNGVKNLAVPIVIPASEPESRGRGTWIPRPAGYCNGSGAWSHFGESLTSMAVTHLTHSKPRFPGATSLTG